MIFPKEFIQKELRIAAYTNPEKNLKIRRIKTLFFYWKKDFF